jgi:mycothiol synthase
MTMALPAGHRVRAPTVDDVSRVVELLVACDVAETGAPDVNEADLASDWEQPRVDLARDAWIVERDDGRIVAYAYLWDRADHADFDGNLHVRPGEDFELFAPVLLERIEERAREQAVLAAPGADVQVLLYAVSTHERYRALVVGRGFRPVRVFRRMRIEIPGDLPAPHLPEGIVISSVAGGVDPRSIHALLEHAFAGHFMHVRLSYEEFRKRFEEHAEYDPALFLAALHVDEVVGIAMAYDHGDTGFVRELGVREDWRGRGVGSALLQLAFRALRERGQALCALGVDSENASGATRLYERAGMKVAFQLVMYEKRGFRGPSSE